MPILNTERSFTKIILPSSKPNDEAWVEVWDKIFTSDIVALASSSSDKSQAVMETLTRIIKDWNFTDKEGNKLPVTAENINYMDIIDIAKITEETQAFKGVEALPVVKKKN